MKTVQRYQTEDGKVFDTEELAAAHETLVGRVNEIINALGKKCDDIRNGSGYVQHNPDIVDKIKISFHELALDDQKLSGKDIGGYAIGRYLGQSNDYLYGVWSRLYCIDELGREFDQQFYTNNPHKCVMKEFKSC